MPAAPRVTTDGLVVGLGLLAVLVGVDVALGDEFHVGPAYGCAAVAASTRTTPRRTAAVALCAVIAAASSLMWSGARLADWVTLCGVTAALAALAVTTAKRHPEMPDIPTMAEAGVPGYEAAVWYGLLAPANVPAPLVAKLHRFPVDPRADVAGPPHLEELLAIFAFPAAHDRRKNLKLTPLGQRTDRIHHLLHRLGGDFLAALVTIGPSNASKQQAQIVVDLGDRTNGRTGIVTGRFLLDRDGRRQSFDRIDVRLSHLLEKLPGIRRERLHVPALPFCIDRVERQRRFPGAAQAGDDDQLVAGNFDVDVLEIVLACALDDDRVAHGRRIITLEPFCCWTLWSQKFSRANQRDVQTGGRQGRSKRRPEAYIITYVEGQSEARTQPAACFNIPPCLDKAGNQVLPPISMLLMRESVNQKPVPEASARVVSTGKSP